MAWLSVISVTMTKAVIGACTTPAKYDTMPSRMIGATGAVGNRCAMLAPSPAPTASDGEKMPPGMPLTVENVVARNLNSPKSPPSGLPPSSAAFTCA